MQTMTANVLLNGDIRHQVTRIGITPAESVLLRLIHGEDCLIELKRGSDTRRPHAEELQRLKQFYGDKRVEAAFPGAFPQLPINFDEVGVDLPGPVKGKNAKKREKEEAAKSAEADDVSHDPAGDKASEPAAATAE